MTTAVASPDTIVAAVGSLSMTTAAATRDTIASAISTVEMLDAMYARSLNTMMIYLSVLVLVVAILIPILTWFHQRKLFQVEEAQLLGRMETRFDELKEELEELVGVATSKDRESVQAALGSMRTELRRRMSFAAAGVFFLQGNSNRERGDLLQATCSYIDAAAHSLQAHDNENLQNSLKLIADSCLPGLSANQWADAPDIAEAFERLLKDLSEKDKDSHYTNYIKRIRVAHNEMLKRGAAVPESDSDDDEE